MYKNLGEFLSRLEREGELLRVSAHVDPAEEMAEIADRMAKSRGGGKALLFENTGTGFPVAMNLFGSERRMSMALGVDSLDRIPERIDDLARKVMSPMGSLGQKLSALPVVGELSRWFPVHARGRGECQEVVLTGEDARLSLLPVLKCWEHDGGRFVTLPLVNTVDPDTGARNVGVYRMQIFDDRRTGMHWHMHKTGARHYEAYRRRGGRMPVSVCLGGDPVYTYSAVAPMPDGVDEYLLAGFLRGKPVRLVRCVTNGLRVPYDCDFVIEGYVDTSEDKVMEGPFGDHTGFYSLEDLYPVFHVTAITHRRDAVYPATIVGIPPQEDMYMTLATEKIFLAPIRLLMQPEITDMHMPSEGAAHNLAVVNIRKSYRAQAAKVASSLWGAGQMMFNKYLIVTATDGDIRDPRELASLIRGTDIGRSLVHGTGVLDILDHATPTTGAGGKLALDLTETAYVMKMGGELATDQTGSKLCRPSQDMKMGSKLVTDSAGSDGFAAGSSFAGSKCTVSAASSAGAAEEAVLPSQPSGSSSPPLPLSPSSIPSISSSPFPSRSVAPLSSSRSSLPFIAPLLALPEVVVTAGGVKSWNLSLFAEWGIAVLYAAPDAKVDTAAFICTNNLNEARIIVLVDEMAEGLSPAELLWIAAANSDPARDASLLWVSAAENDPAHYDSSLRGILAIDARTKLPGCKGNPSRFPNVTTSSEKIIELVDSRWNEYGLGELIPSPSRRYRKLLMSDKASIN